MTGLLAQLKPMFVLQGLSCGLMFALMIVVLGVMVLVAASVGGTGLKLANMFSNGKKQTKRQEQDKSQQEQHRQRMQQIQQRRADAQRRRQLAQQRLQMQRGQRRHQ
jgi:Flp pilus assembly protein TadB